MNAVTSLFLAAQLVYSCRSLPLDAKENHAPHPDDEVWQEEFFQTVEAAVHHIVHSRDMHRAFKRAKRQLNNNFGSGGLGGFGQGSLAGLGQASNGLGSFGGGFGGLNGLNGLNGASGLGAGGLGSGALSQGAGTLLDGLENFSTLTSLEALGSGAASNAGPLAPVLQGIGSTNRVVKTMVDLDRMRCVPRLACEYMANRGLFNRTGAIIAPAVLSSLPNNTQAALNISNPSTFRTVLGLLQLVRLQEFGAYPYLEAGLWGAAHRDYNRCRNQFTKCPSTSEAFISELNTTPGGLQGMFTNAIQSLRNSLPGIGSGAGGASAQPTRITSGLQSASNLGNFGSLSNFGQQGLTSTGSLGALGNNIGNQQLFNPSSGLLSGGSNTGLGAGSFAGNVGSSFANPSLSSSAFLNGLGTGSLGTLGTGTNLNQLNNLGNLGLNGANFGNLAQNGLLFNSPTIAGGQNGANFGTLAQNGLFLNSLASAGGQNGLLSGAQFGSLGGTQFGSLSNAQLGNLGGNNPGILNFASNSFGSQLSPSTLQSGFGGFNNVVANFRAGSEGQNTTPKKETGKRWKWSI